MDNLDAGTQEGKIERYCFEYRYRGRLCGFRIPAVSKEEAWEKLRCMQDAKLYGRWVADIPAGPSLAATGFFAGMFCWFRNLFSASGRR